MSGIIAQNTLDNSGLIKAPAGGAWNFISKQTASADATIDFTSGIDSTYKEYLFTLNNIHPSDDGQVFRVNFRDGSTAYDAVKTTTSFRSYHDEGDTATALEYVTSEDLAQGTGVQHIANSGSDNDQCMIGYLHLFNPSSTTFVKHFIIRTNSSHSADYTNEWFVAGYCNTTTAIDGVQFSFASGTIDAGDICLYGLTT
jgi:hypothetical protein